MTVDEGRRKVAQVLCDINTLEVPFFQRPYVWENENWQEFLDDLLKGELQFLGSIIIKWQDRNQQINVKEGCSKISNASIQERIKTDVKVNLGRMLLFWIELYRRYKDERYDQASFKYNYQLEHIMPQEWSEHWQNVPYTNDKGEELVISDETASSS